MGLTSAMALADACNANDGIHDDKRALAGWLGFVSLRNANTLRSYRKEVGRFRVFLQTAYAHDPNKRPVETLLRDATEVDVLLYEAHLKGSLRTGESVAALVVPQHILRQHGLNEQPFVTYPSDGPAIPIRLKESSVNQALSILHALYGYWMRPDPQTKQAYVGANPVKRIKSASNRMQRQSDHNFPIEAIQAMMQTCEMQLAAHPENAQALARRRWIAAMLFGLWGRRAEVASICMQDFVHDGIRWSVHIKRKGGKRQSLPVAPWVMQELMTYRKGLGLPPLPSRTECITAIQRLRPRNNASTEDPVNPDLIYREIGILSQQASAAVREGSILREVDDVQRELIASKLDQISPHWFRHSGASIAINSGAMSLENASKMLGHSSTVITAEMYYHPDESQISEGMERLGKMVSKLT